HLVGFLKEARPAEPEPAQHSVYAQDPHKVLEDIVDRWIEAEEAERAERGLSGLMPDLPSAQARIDELEAELAALRNALPAPDGAERSAPPAPERAITRGEADVIEPSRLYIGPQRGPDDPPPRSTAVIEGKAVPPAPTAAEREAKRQAINNDRTAY